MRRAGSGACPGAVLSWGHWYRNKCTLSALYSDYGALSLSQHPSTDIDSLIAYQQNQKLINEQKFLTDHLSGFSYDQVYYMPAMWASEPSIMRQDLSRKSIHSLRSLVCFFIRSGITESRHQDTCYSPPCFELSVITKSTDFIYNLESCLGTFISPWDVMTLMTLMSCNIIVSRSHMIIY